MNRSLDVNPAQDALSRADALAYIGKFGKPT